MNIPEGYKLVPVNPTEIMQDFGCSNMPVDWASPFEAAKVYSAMVGAAPNAEIPAYDEAKERELFTAFAMESFLSVHRGEGRDYFYAETEAAWLGWKACAKSRARSAE